MKIKNIFHHQKIWPVVGLTGIFSIVLVFAFNLKHDYEAELANAASDSQHLAFAAAHHAADTIQKADFVLNRLVDEFSPERGDKGLYPQRISSYLSTLQLKQLELKSLNVIKADGHVLYSLADSGDAISPLYLGDNAFFAAHRDSPDLGLTLSDSVQEQGSPARSLILSRRLNNPDGSFAGVVSAAMNPMYFESFAGALNPGKNGSLALLNEKLVVFAHFPAGGRFIGKSLAGSPLEAQRQKTPRDGTYSGAFEGDKVERIFSFRQIGDFPLYVNAGLAKQDVLAEWHRSALIDSAIMTALIGVILFLFFGRVRRSGTEQNEVPPLPLRHVRNRVEESLDPLFTISPDGFIIDANPAAELITGLSRTQLAGNIFCDYFTKPDEAREVCQKAFAGGFVHDCPLFICNANGHVTEVSCTISEYWNMAGDVRAAYVVASDMTERRWSERLLKFEISALENICDGADMLATLDILCRGVEGVLDESLCAIMLLDDDGLHLRHAAAPSLPNDYNQAIDGIPVGPTSSSCGAAAYAGQPVICTDIAHDPAWVDCHELALSHGLAACYATPIYSKKKDLLGILAVYYCVPYQPTQFDLQVGARAADLISVAIQRKRADSAMKQLNENLQQQVVDAATQSEENRAKHLASITLLRKRADESLSQLNKDMEQRVKEEIAGVVEIERKAMRQSRLAATGEIIENIAHQWRQPLSALDMLLGRIRDEIEFHHEIDPQMLVQSSIKGQRTIHEMFGVIDDLRSSFRADKKKVVFSLNNEIRGAIEILSASFHDCNIKTQIEAGEDVIAFGFPDIYSQVLRNILNNAKDRLVANNATNGVIHIRVASVGERACIVVRDSAGGLSADILAKIFEPCVASRSEDAGIGFYLSKMIIEDSMDGKIEVRNVEGGTEFVLTCPVAK